MLSKPLDILDQFSVRKSKKQKKAFLNAVQEYVSTLGYESTVEQGSFGCRNLVIGDPEKARYLVTAHYDTCAKLPFPNFIAPCNLLGFVLCQAAQIMFMLLSACLLAFAQSILIAGILVMAGRDLGDAWILFAGLIAPTLSWLNLILVIAFMLFGPANKSNANDNTSGVVTLLEIARSMPENQRHKVCFILFDLEEAGLIGSAAYRKAHKRVCDEQIVLNLDCVGEGDHIVMFPTKKMKQNRKKLTSLYKACGYFGSKSVTVREKGFSVYPSDQVNFPYGVGICALKPSKFGMYLGRIHTKKDTILEETNVNILRAALTTYICCDAVQ